MDKRYNVLIVEDNPLERKLFEMLFRESEKYNVVASIESASFAEVYCIKKHIDLIIMDVLTALDSSGLEFAKRIKSKYKEIKIIIVTSQPEYDFLERARDGGVDSFWYKNSDESGFMDVVDRTIRGESVYPAHSPEIKLGLADSSEFTKREIQVLRELLSGATDEAIAKRLDVSIYTVKKHIKSMFLKTGFTSRTQLAVNAREKGFVISGF